MKNIIFMPFINDGSAIAWRTELEHDFITGEGAALTAQVNTVRANKNNGTYANQQEYYKDLHDKKGLRQVMWITRLINETAAPFGAQLAALTAADPDAADPDKTVIVCALPEFFWYDINDNNKHKEIINYHKPIYLETALDILTMPNALMGLTASYPNLIFFAGTAIWKKINKEDHSDEEVFNSLIVYADNDYKESVTKHSVSTIDGFCAYPNILMKKKAGKSTFNGVPVTGFRGLNFTYDICLDFNDGTNPPLSTRLCRQAGRNDIDVNVLIAAGMPVTQSYADNNIMSDILLRCDGLHTPYGEVIIKSSSSANTAAVMSEVRVAPTNP